MGKFELGSSGQCIKYLLHAANTIFLLMGCTLIGVGIWIMLKRDFVSQIIGTPLMTISIYMIIAAGSLIVIVYLVGCCGAILENKPVLLAYTMMILVIVAVLLIAGILGIVFRAQIGERVRQHMKDTLRTEYGTHLEKRRNRLVTDAWDNAQRELRCCAVDDHSWNLYYGSEWFKDQTGIPHVSVPLVPESCCRVDQHGDFQDKMKCQTWQHGPPKTQGNEIGGNGGLHYRGCYQAGKDHVREFAGYIIGMGIGVGIIMMSGFILAMLLYRQL